MVLVSWIVSRLHIVHCDVAVTSEIVESVEVAFVSNRWNKIFANVFDFVYKLITYECLISFDN